jgi:hypothetical protein
MRISSVRRLLPSVSQNFTEPLADVSGRIGPNAFSCCFRLAAAATYRSAECWVPCRAASRLGVRFIAFHASEQRALSARGYEKPLGTGRRRQSPGLGRFCSDSRIAARQILEPVRVE